MKPWSSRIQASRNRIESLKNAIESQIRKRNAKFSLSVLLRGRGAPGGRTRAKLQPKCYKMEFNWEPEVGNILKTTENISIPKLMRKKGGHQNGHRGPKESTPARPKDVSGTAGRDLGMGSVDSVLVPDDSQLVSDAQHSAGAATEN